MGDLNLSIKKSFGEKMKLARSMTGYSRQKLSVELGVSSKTIQSWETGRTFPENMSLVPVIEQKLGFFIPDILGETVREEVAKAGLTTSKPEKIVRRAAVINEEKEAEEEEEAEEESPEEIDEV